MAYNSTTSLNKLTCTDYVDFGKCHDSFGWVSWSKKDSNYLDIKPKVFNREDKIAEFRVRQNFLMQEADFNEFIRQRNQLVVAADNFLREKIVVSSSIYTNQRHGGATEACSQGDWRCGLTKQKDLCDTTAIQGRQPRHVFCSSSSIRSEEGGREISTNFVCQLKTWSICISSRRHEFSVW